VRDHGIVGIGADFVPSLLDRDLIDEVVTVTTQEAIDTTLRLSREMGLLVGISSGANVAAALRVMQRLGEGKVVVTVLPDTGERYPNLTH
jgi:cysteine synthase A